MIEPPEDEQCEPWNKQMMTPRLQARLEAYRKFLEEWRDYEGDEIGYEGER